MLSWLLWLDRRNLPGLRGLRGTSEISGAPFRHRRNLRMVSGISGTPGWSLGPPESPGGRWARGRRNPREMAEISGIPGKWRESPESPKSPESRRNLRKVAGTFFGATNHNNHICNSKKPWPHDCASWLYVEEQASAVVNPQARAPGRFARRVLRWATTAAAVVLSLCYCVCSQAPGSCLEFVWGLVLDWRELR